MLCTHKRFYSILTPFHPLFPTMLHTTITITLDSSPPPFRNRYKADIGYIITRVKKARLWWCSSCYYVACLLTASNGISHGTLYPEKGVAASSSSMCKDTTSSSSSPPLLLLLFPQLPCFTTLWIEAYIYERLHTYWPLAGMGWDGSWIVNK